MHGSTEAGQDSSIASSHSRAWVEVDLGALRRNAALLAGRAGVPILPMIKADAYGLGARMVARALEPLDPFAFGLAALAEARDLRAAGVERRLMVFTPLLVEELAAARALGVTPTLGSRETIAAWRELGGGPWHLAIDTGMNRAGVRWDDVDSLRGAIAQLPPEGAFTHLHSAELSDGSVAVQEGRFRAAIERLPSRPRYLHVENSPALERRSPSPWDLARPGVFMYGVGGEGGAEVSPEQVVDVLARVVDIRTVRDGESVSYDATWTARGDRRVATVAIGYADGLRRALSDRGQALLHGRRVPIAGLVTMDMTMLDVTDVPCEAGDVACFLGGVGPEPLTVTEVARTAELSPYELLTGLRLRMPRFYGQRRAAARGGAAIASEAAP